jgi:hypothetical protein
MARPAGDAGHALQRVGSCASSLCRPASVGGSRPISCATPHAVELAREGVAVNIIQRQLGHTDLGTTSTYLQGIDPSEIIDAVRLRRQPTISAAASLRL